MLEVLVSGAVLSTVLIALVMLLSYSVKSDDQARNRAVASELAQEGADFFRQERNILGWAGLSSILTDNATYCLADLNNFSQDTNNHVYLGFLGSCSGYNIERGTTNYKREAVVTKNPNEIDVVVTVSWLNDNNVEVNSVSRLKLKRF